MNYRFEYKDTAFIISCREINGYEKVKLLLDNNVDVEAKNENEETGFFWACRADR